MKDGGEKSEYDVIIAGAGASGLMAGVYAASRGLRTAIAEKEDRFPKKLLITGKGRCNVANAGGSEAFFSNVRHGAKFLQSAYRSFTEQDICEFFERRGVPLKVERGCRVFPVSDRAADIANALVKAAKDAGVEFIHGAVECVLTHNGAVRGVKLRSGQKLDCRGAIIATGGLSYPSTGSTGDGYRMAKTLGHTLTDRFASLVPLECEGDYGELMGLSLKNVRLSAQLNGKRIFDEEGEMLFTHFGISGPLTLTLSSMLAGKDLSPLELLLDLKPALDEQTLDKRILRDFSQNLNREFRNSLSELLPKKMIPAVVAQSGIDPAKRINSITAAERASLVRALKRYPIKVLRARPVEEAVVTAGGVELREIDPKTMMSKIVGNLHFAGEVLDADGFTGGFNLMIAFASGHAAGIHILEEEQT